MLTMWGRIISLYIVIIYINEIKKSTAMKYERYLQTNSNLRSKITIEDPITIKTSG